MPLAFERYHVGEQVYLGAADRPWAAWHYAVAGAATALVIVPPYGFEAINAHRALRAFAIRAAEAGIDAWRIDLDGTGDSAGDDRDPDRVTAWCASIDAAIDAARAEGATRIVLAGVRLGATLAVKVAADRDDIAGVIAIAPVVAGKKWLREMRALQGALGLPPPPAYVTLPEGDDALGFWIAPATRDAITALDLEKAERSPRSVFVIDRDDLPASDKWLAALRARGATVTHARLPGYVDMMLDAHKAEIPDAIIAAAIEQVTVWGAGAAATPPANVPWPRVATLGAIVEEPVTIAGMAAIASRPADQARPRRALLLLNAGAVRQVGPNRMYVAIARRCAAEGALVVRADLTGLGDSPPIAGQPDRVVYTDSAAAEIAALVAWCRAAGAQRIALAGLCSGGYYTLQRAVAGEDVAAIVVINPGNPNVEVHQATEDAERYGRSIRDLEKWKKLLKGGVDLRRLGRSVVSRVRDRSAGAIEQLARRIGRPLARDLGAQLAALLKRGIATTFIFCADEPELVRFREHVGPLMEKLERAGLMVRVVEGPDHTFTPTWSQAVLVDEVAAALRRLT